VLQSELRTTRSEFDAELRSIQASHVRERKELLSIIESVEQAERERDNEARQEHDTEREDIRTKNIDDINMLRLTLESVIDDLEKQFDEAHAQYMENTEKKTKDFKALTEEDKKFSDEIDRQLRQIERLQTLLTYWRKKIGQSEREGRERNRQLKAEKEMVMKHYHELKDRMNASRNGQSRRLTELALWAREAFDTNTERIHVRHSSFVDIV
jgi:DNA repair exonuclease SbcCD ATPase subunit